MDREQVQEAAYRQLAIDFNARPEDFQSGRITFTAPALLPGRRLYSTETPFLELVTVGGSAVIMADERLWPALREWSADAEEAHWLLELPRMLKLAGILAPYGYELTQTFHHYLPSVDFPPVEAPEGLRLRWLEREEILDFYPNRDWPNALQDQDNPARPDALALLALDGEKPAGMAGASIDAMAAKGKDFPEFWQIGIDVLPAYRGRGLGALLVRGLAREVERRGAVPFYGTSLSNIYSQNIAWKCGFRPAWAGVSAKRRKADG